MPIIHAVILKGRAGGQKDRLAAAITEATVNALNVAPEQVRVLLHEVEPEGWYIGGKSKKETA